MTLTLWQGNAESAEMEGSQAARDLSHWRGRVWAAVWTLSWVSVSHSLNTFLCKCELQFEHFIVRVWVAIWTLCWVSVSCNLNTFLVGKCGLQFQHLFGWMWPAIWTLSWLNVTCNLNTFLGECKPQFENFFGWTWPAIWTLWVSVSCSLHTFLGVCEPQFDFEHLAAVVIVLAFLAEHCLFNYCTCGGVYVPYIYLHARWDLFEVIQVFVVVVMWCLSSADFVVWNELWTNKNDC